MDFTFWKGRKVLVTGHTGFKGSWLSLWLQNLDAKVVGVSLDPPTTQNLYEQAQVADGMISLREDIRDLNKMKSIFIEHQPEIVFHLAAQPLVRYSYREPVETYATNVMGTLHILEAIRECNSVRATIIVTTDKCYDNKEWEWEWGYRENEPMGGHDPYSSSKGCAELLVASYRDSYFPTDEYSQHQTGIATVRAGNVIGGGDWAEGWNFGPQEEDAKLVGWIVKELTKQWGGDAAWNIDKGGHPHEANYLKLDCSRAHNRLQWWPKWDLQTALKMIVEWHKLHADGYNMSQICMRQITEYQAVGEMSCKQ